MKLKILFVKILETSLSQQHVTLIVIYERFVDQEEKKNNQEYVHHITQDKTWHVLQSKQNT